MTELYPWGGEYTEGADHAPVAVVTLSEEMVFPPEKVAIWGRLRTENLGVEKVVANIISNPNIRYLLICGQEIRGHRAGQTLVSLWRYGVDSAGRIIGARGAMPYVENLEMEAIDRFRRQIEVIDMVGVVDSSLIAEALDRAVSMGPGPFEDGPYIAVRGRKASDRIVKSSQMISIHSVVFLDPYGDLTTRLDNRDREA